MERRYSDELATGSPQREKLRIVGRPKAGTEETFVIVEEPGEPVLMHFVKRLDPHFKRDCPFCRGVDPPPELKAFWYIGCLARVGEMAILELTQKCFETAEAASRKFLPPVAGVDLFGQPLAPTSKFTGLTVRIGRASFEHSPRVLRCDQRVRVAAEWPYRTREELARVWGIPTRPQLFREA